MTVVGQTILLLFLNAGAADTPALELAIHAEPKTVEFGQSVSVTVKRRWPEGFIPDPWLEQNLAPLRPMLLDAERQKADGAVEETLHYRGYACSLEDIVLPAIRFSARALTGGEHPQTASQPFSIAITPAIDRDSPALAELPRTVFAATPGGWPSWVLPGLLLGLVLATTLLLYQRVRRSAGNQRSSDERSTRQKLDALFQALEAEQLTLSSFCREFADILRHHFWPGPAPNAELTSEQFLEQRQTAGSAAPTLKELLLQLDRVRYGAVTLSTDEQRELRQKSLDLLTGGGSGP